LGVYLFFLTSATKLHFFLGVFFHFIIGADNNHTKPLLDWLYRGTGPETNIRSAL